MNKALNTLAIALATMAHLFAGSAIVAIGRAHMQMLGGFDAALPLISRFVIPYIQGPWPLVVGGVLGLLTLVGIGFAARSERGVGYLPILLSISYLLVVLHVVVVWCGTSMPLFRIMHGVSQ